ncbi:amidohydrolase family protein [Streptomyces lavendofoliae]|uniref:amidohydrolase family protein n=1 Tax=Streptomyces lavendofoliae TaxID=67314 RepID=UPI00300F4CAD
MNVSPTPRRPRMAAAVGRYARKRFTIAVAALAAASVAATPVGAGSASVAADCFDRRTQPYTSQVDGHLHFRPFGGKAIPFDEVVSYLRKSGVHHANVFGIGQKLPADSACTYYLDCPGTPVLPSIKNDVVNGENYVGSRPADPHLTLSMTSFDVANPESIPADLAMYDEEFPGQFRWGGELNVVKAALFHNHHEPATPEDIDEWADFMAVLEERNIPLTLHSDLGNDQEPTKYLHLLERVLDRYPRNKIVWAHMGLSKELATMAPHSHITITKRLLDEHPNLTLDLSWRVLHDQYFTKPQVRRLYARFLDAYPSRAIPGTDFVASADKNYAVYKQELEVTSRINKDLGDEAFRRIALGQNYFDLLRLKDRAPVVCAARPATS